MAGGLYKVVVSLAPASGLPEDFVQNTFFFTQNDDTTSVSEDADDIATLLEDFYDGVHAPGSVALSTFINASISRATNASTFDFYRHASFSPNGLWGSPVAMRSWTLGAETAGTSLPNEVCLVGTFNGDLTNVPETQTNPSPPPATIRPASRRRGRVFLGPFNVNALTEDANTLEGIPTTSLRNAVAGACDNLASLSPSSNLKWVVASKADDDTYVVEAGYVDNRFDTQRRRGQEANARTPWSI